MLVTLLPAQAEIQSRLASQNPTLPGHSVFQVTFEPPGDGKPDNTVGGASRDSGQCLQDAIASQQTITPLMPTTNRGLTLVERPTFFVYVPQTSAQKAFFSLKDKDESYYYQATLPMPETSGIVSLKLPADAPALEIINGRLSQSAEKDLLLTIQELKVRFSELNLIQNSVVSSRIYHP
jgi:hypothetical protein